jgi:hypothetical protein
MAWFKKQPKVFGDVSPLEMLEQAFYVLRSLRIHQVMPQLVSAGLFLWALLSAFADLSQAGESRFMIEEWALILAVLYLHMKVWQSVFSRWVWRELQGGEALAPLGWRAALRQTCALWGIHAWSFPLHLLAAILLPLAWVYAGYQACTTLVYTRPMGRQALRTLWRESWRACLYQPINNHTLLAFLFGFGAIVWAAVYFTALMAPYLIHLFTGEQNALTLHPFAYALNTLLITSTIGFTWLITSPFFRIVYTLRLFYSLSRQSGEDLLARMKGLSKKSVAGMVMAMLFFASVGPATAADKSPPPVPTTAEIQEMDRLIKTSTSSAQYRWAPRPDKSKLKQEIDDQKKSGWVQWIRRTFEKIGKLMRKIREAIFGENYNDKNPGEEGKEAWWASWYKNLETWIWITIGTTVLLLSYGLYQWRKNKKKTPSVEGLARPALSDDWQENDAAAMDLADDEWLRLAQEQLQLGDHRRAVRALYLACLARLHEQKLVRLHRAKTNREYRHELSWHAGRRPELPSVFAEVVQIFEKVWYGHFRPDEGTVTELRHHYERIAPEGQVSHAQ